MSLSRDDFKPLLYHAVMYIDGQQIRADKVIKWIPGPWISRFPDPLIFPVANDAPADIPRMTWQSEKMKWGMTISRSSIALSWRNQLKQEVEELSLDKFLSSSTLLLKSFKKTFGPRIGRLACICQRFARSDASGRFLAGHFCRPALLETPFNRPENFEIHSHKVFPLFAGCKINSWMRVKTAQLSAEPAPAPLVIIAEQDFNTLLEEEPDRAFDDSDISRFYKACPKELDHVLDLYFPKGDK